MNTKSIGRPPLAISEGMQRCQKVVSAMGGNYAVARILGLSPTAVFLWKNYNRGSVPRKHVAKLKEAAKVAGVVIDEGWFE